MTTDTLVPTTSAIDPVDIDPLEAGVEVQQQGIPRLPTAAQVMSQHPAVVDAHTSLFSAWGQLHGEQHRHLVVIDDDVRPIGVLDERDIALEWPPGPLGAHHLPVHKLLRSRTRPRVRAEDDVVSVAQIMLSSREDALPVVDEDGRLLGLITVWQLVELIAGIRGRDQAPARSTAPTPGYDRTAR
jgi:CBS domain-containing protein